MKIESALKHFNPKSLQISDSSRATGSEGLTGTDLMAAIGMGQSKSQWELPPFWLSPASVKKIRIV